MAVCVHGDDGVDQAGASRHPTGSPESHDALASGRADGGRNPGSGPGPSVRLEEQPMVNARSSRPEVDTSSVAYGPEPTAWTGWVVFASFMMLLLGVFQAIQGLVAIFDDGYYRVTQSGLVVNLDYTAWGWTHLLLGVLIVISAVGVLSGNLAARTVAVILAGLSAIANLLFIEAYPLWSIIIITVDILVIYALTVHGRELKGSTM
jgi:hypothetical protein